MPKTATDSKTVDKIAKLLKEGKTYGQVAAETGVHKMTVGKYAKKLGLAKGGKGGRPKGSTNSATNGAAKKPGRPKKVAAQQPENSAAIALSPRDMTYVKWVNFGLENGFVREA